MFSSKCFHWRRKTSASWARLILHIKVDLRKENKILKFIYINVATVTGKKELQVEWRDKESFDLFAFLALLPLTCVILGRYFLPLFIEKKIKKEDFTYVIKYLSIYEIEFIKYNFPHP